MKWIKMLKVCLVGDFVLRTTKYLVGLMNLHLIFVPYESRLNTLYFKIIIVFCFYVTFYHWLCSKKKPSFPQLR